MDPRDNKAGHISKLENLFFSNNSNNWENQLQIQCWLEKFDIIDTSTAPWNSMNNVNRTLEKLNI